MRMPVARAGSRLLQRVADRKDWRPCVHSSKLVSVWALLGIAVLACGMAWAAEPKPNLTVLPPAPDRGLADRGWVANMPLSFAPASWSSQFARPFEPSQEYGLPRYGKPVLSPAAARVSLIANGNGDRNFLVVDKTHGEIILFTDGRPVFRRAALTGESMADRIPPDAWRKPWSQQRDVKYKVTPAGRFTLTRDHDRALGDLFDIN